MPKKKTTTTSINANINAHTSIGVTVYMPNCSFQAEISREAIPESVSDIDEELNTKGVDLESITRIATVMSNTMNISTMMANGEIDQEQGVSYIAFGFVYAFVKEQGFDKLINLRGLIGCLSEDKLYLNPCVDADSYKKAVATMNSAAKEMIGYDDDEMVDMTPKKPTIH